MGLARSPISGEQVASAIHRLLPVTMDSNSFSNSDPTYRLDPSMLRVLNRLPREMVENLTESELIALHRAISRSAKHPIDIRFTLPWFPKRIYLVFTAGFDRREGLPRSERKKPWTPLTTAFAMTLGLATLLTAYTASYRVLQSRSAAAETEAAQAEEPDIHPTALPWVESVDDCSGQTRQWKDNLCFESDHDPNFRR